MSGFWSHAAPGLDSPSPYNEPQCLQVAVVGGPQGRCHPILVRRVQLLPSGLFQHAQVSVPGRPVVPVVHGDALPFGSLRVRLHWDCGGFPLARTRVLQFPDPGRGVSKQRGGQNRDRAGWTVTRRRAVGGSIVGEGEELKC